MTSAADKEMLAINRVLAQHGQGEDPEARQGSWWGRCDDCGYLIDTPNHVIGCEGREGVTDQCS